MKERNNHEEQKRNNNYNASVSLNPGASSTCPGQEKNILAQISDYANNLSRIPDQDFYAYISEELQNIIRKGHAHAVASLHC